MKASKLLHKTKHILKANSPAIMSGVAVGGVISTAYFAAVATVKASRIIEKEESSAGTHGKFVGRLKERVPLVWKLYIPTAASGAVTIGCIVGSTRISARRGAAVQAALVIAERTYDEYRDKVIEEYGARKDQTIRDSIAEDKVAKSTLPNREIAIVGPGTTLCMELHTGRYFHSDMETLRRAENQLNQRLLQHDTASLNDWYDMIGLEPTSYSDDLGWNSNDLMELQFTSVLAGDGRPVLAFDYNYVKPIYEGLFTT